MHNAFMISPACQYLRDCVVAISQMIRAGDFSPVMSEISFGKSKSGGDSIGELTLTLLDGRRLTLNGRIDRLDIAKIEGRKVAVVFDYKKRSKIRLAGRNFIMASIFSSRFICLLSEAQAVSLRIV